MMHRLVSAFLVVGALSFSPKAALHKSVTLHASAADVEALSARLGDAAVLGPAYIQTDGIHWERQGKANASSLRCVLYRT